MCPFQICPSSCSLHLSTVDVHAPCPLGGPAHETLAGITHDICMLLETRVNVRCVLTDFSKTIDPLFTVSARFLIFIACMDHCFSPSECSIILTLVLDVCINQ